MPLGQSLLQTRPPLSPRGSFTERCSAQDLNEHSLMVPRSKSPPNTVLSYRRRRRRHDLPHCPDTVCFAVLGRGGLAQRRRERRVWDLELLLGSVFPRCGLGVSARENPCPGSDPVGESRLLLRSSGGGLAQRRRAWNSELYLARRSLSSVSSHHRLRQVSISHPLQILDALRHRFERRGGFVLDEVMLHADGGGLLEDGRPVDLSGA